MGDAQLSEAAGEAVRIGEGMAPIAPGFRSGQVLIQVDEARAWYVRFPIGAAPGLGIGEIVSAVAYDPRRIAEARREAGRGDEGGMHGRTEAGGERRAVP